jgi:hypothetical protein
MLYNKRWDLDEIGKILWDAADYIEQAGWTQHALETSNGRVCMLGAIIKSGANGSFNQYPAVERLAIHLGRKCGDLAGFVVTWNDYTCKSQEQAVEALRAAAKKVSSLALGALISQ